MVTRAFKDLVLTHGVAATAKILGRRYAAVRDAVTRAGIKVGRGRRVSAKIKIRDKEIRLERKTGKKLLRQIGKKFKLGKERVRQILVETGGDPLKDK